MQISEFTELTKAAYAHTADKYHSHFQNEMDEKPYDREVLDRFAEQLPEGAVVCDAGCGPSAQAGRYLLDKGHQVIGIDLSARCVEIARTHYPQIDFREMDMMSTRFEAESLNGFVSFYSIIHTPKAHVDTLFKEFNRILKKGGQLLVVVKKGEDAGIVKEDWYEGDAIYFSNFMESEIQTYFEENNFSLDFFETRQAYKSEFQVDRIYAIGSKQ